MEETKDSERQLLVIHLNLVPITITLLYLLYFGTYASKIIYSLYRIHL